MLKKHFFPILAITLFSSSIFYNIFNLAQGWYQSINDEHAFRQSQTAITAYYFVKDGLSLDYKTPVLGFPYKIPIEFPLYQWIVALISKHLNFPLIQTGRAVSVAFYFLAIVCLYFILRHFKQTLFESLFLLSFILFNPVYNFWPRTFMMETTSVFFSLLFVLLALKTHKLGWIVIFATFIGALSACLKPTTHAIFLAFIVFVYFINLKNSPQKFVFGDQSS